MSFILWGISHKTAPLKVREKFSFSRKQIPEVLIKLSRKEGTSEMVILSTCNRMEIYTTSDYPEEVREFLSSKLCIEKEELQYFYFLKDKKVIKHLFLVSSGVDSQIIGETQILGQVKNAYFQAKELGMTGKYLNRLFQKAIEVGKLVHRVTKISQGNISIGSVALKLAEDRGGDLKEKKILIIGTGKIGELVAKYLIGKGVSGTFVANRTYEKARELAEKIGGEAIRFDNLKVKIKETDIIISATGSPHLILKKGLIQEIMEFRKKPLCIIDLALPRDVDPEIKTLEKVSLYNLDDLNLIREENYRKRKKEVKKVKKIVQKEVEKFWKGIIPTFKAQKLELVHVPVA